MVDPMLPEETNLAAMAETLGKSPNYRVLRRLVPRTEFASCEGQETKTGIMLDVETTGLDTARDEVIELAMVKFTYLPDDRIARITEVFSSFNEPQNPIPAEITDLTGITAHAIAKAELADDVPLRRSLRQSPPGGNRGACSPHHCLKADSAAAGVIRFALLRGSLI
jgi:DNA polymerase-3 subunit epsilon